MRKVSRPSEGFGRYIEIIPYPCYFRIRGLEARFSRLFYLFLGTVRRLTPKVLNAKTSALRPRITPHLEDYLDNARISGVEVRLK